MAQYVASTLRRGQSGVGAFAIAEYTDLKLSDTIAVDLTGRNAIEEWRRTPHMACYVVSEDKTYRLGSDVTIVGQVWTEIQYADPNALVYDDVFDGDGFVKPELLRNLFINDSFVVDSEVEMLAATSVTGNVFVRTDNGGVYLKLNNDDPADISDFANITADTGAVTSVNGMTGAVSITISNLLSVGANLTAFNSAVSSNSTVSGHTASIASLTSNKADLVSGTVPLVQLPYDFDNGITLDGSEVKLGGSLLYDTEVAMEAFNFKINKTGAGQFGFDLGSDATYDLFYRGSDGYIKRLPIGSNNQVLKVSGGALVFSSDLSGVTANPFADDTALVKNNIDNTKTATFSASGISTATNRNYTLQDFDGPLLTGYGVNNLIGTAQSTSIKIDVSTPFNDETSEFNIHADDLLEGNVFTYDFILKKVSDSFFQTTIELGIKATAGSDFIGYIGYEAGQTYPVMKFTDNQSGSTGTVVLGQQGPVYNITGTGFFGFQRGIQYGTGRNETQWTTNTLVDKAYVLNSSHVFTSYQVFRTNSTAANTAPFYVSDGSAFMTTPENGAFERRDAAGGLAFTFGSTRRIFTFNNAVQTLTNKTLTAPKLDGSSTVGYVWTATGTDGSGAWQAASGGGSPGGTDTQVQFNDSGSFAGDGGFVWNNTTKTLRLSNLDFPTHPLTGTRPAVNIGSMNSDPSGPSTGDLFYANAIDKYRGYISGSFVNFITGDTGATDGLLLVANGTGGASLKATQIKINNFSGIELTATDWSSPGKYVIKDASVPNSRRMEISFGASHQTTTGDGISDQPLYDTFSLPNNTVVILNIVGPIIKSDGSSAGAATGYAIWRKDNSGVLTKVGESITFTEDATGLFTVTTVNAGAFIQYRQTRSSSTSGTYANAAYIVNAVIHSY